MSSNVRQVLPRILTVALIACSAAPRIHAQQDCPRILEQDPELNNLVDPPGSPTAPLGSLGGVLRAGTGSQAMILIPGLGFSAEIFTDFMREFAGDYRMFAVTLPGFGGTAPPPAPAESVSFGEQPWTNGALAGIEKLIAEEKLERPIIVGHWLTGTQLALRLALRHPDQIKAVVLLSGSARMTANNPAQAAQLATLEQRVAITDRYMAPRWFKTVTRETWDDNNFLPGDYAVNPVRGLRLWRAAAAPKLHVWVRYLCEFNAQDVGLELSALTVPTLLLQPGLEGLEFDPSNNYMESFCLKSWEGCIENLAPFQVKTISHARACPWFDQPTAVKQAMTEFLKSADGGQR